MQVLVRVGFLLISSAVIVASQDIADALSPEAWELAIKSDDKPTVKAQLDDIIKIVTEAASRDRLIRQAVKDVTMPFATAIYSRMEDAPPEIQNLDWDKLINNVTERERDIDAMTPLKAGISWLSDRLPVTVVARESLADLVEAKRDLQDELQEVKAVTDALYYLLAMDKSTKGHSNVRILRLVATFYGKGGGRLNEDADENGDSVTLQHALSKLQNFSQAYE